MTATIKKEKEAFLLNQLKNGERTGAYLESELRRAFPGNVSNRFRSEMDGLIKSGKVTRTGTGDKAVFKMARAGSRAKTNPVTSHPFSRTRPASVPVVENPKVEKFDADIVTRVVEPTLSYLARNGEREVCSVFSKAIPDQNLDVFSVLSAFVLMVKRGLVNDDRGNLSITREGYQCLDSVRAGEKFA